MFEFEQEIVNTLLTENADFKRLYEKHGKLKQRVHDANIRSEPLDDTELEKLKKEKLLLKDRMAYIINDYRRAHP